MMKIIYSLALIVLVFELSNACRCMPPTQQTSYCRSQWISHARIVSKQNLGSSVEYTVNHVEVFKNHTSALPNKVFTPNSSAACGVTELKVGTDYLLAGTTNSGTNALQLSSCLYMPGSDFQPNGFPVWSQVPNDLQLKLRQKDFKPCPIA
uniref:NTR domain-containing protein n=1 Tax=Panagrolaimus sp. ES5 TaxID=591445 RepID=A0AC34FB44_9BILA